MELNSLRLKVVRLAQRSRRAIRLYTSVYNSVSSSSFSSSSAPSKSSSFTSPSQHGGKQGVVGLLNDADIQGTPSSRGVSNPWLGPKFSAPEGLSSSDLYAGGESHTLANTTLAALSTRAATSKAYRNSGERFSEIQAAEWRDVNLTLLRSLTSALEEPKQRDLPRRILSIREAFGEQWRSLNARLQTNRSEAISAAERADFINLALLGESLVSLKARCQASEAAYHELSEVCKGISYSNNSNTTPTAFSAQSTTSSVKHAQVSGYDQQPIFQVIKSSGSSNKREQGDVARLRNISEDNLGGNYSGNVSNDQLERQPHSFATTASSESSHDQNLPGNSAVTTSATDKESELSKTDIAKEQKVSMLKMAFS